MKNSWRLSTIARCAKALTEEWRRGGSGAVIDVAPPMSKVTLAIILQAVLRRGAEALDQRKFLAALNPALSTIAWRFLYARMGIPDAAPAGLDSVAAGEGPGDAETAAG